MEVEPTVVEEEATVPSSAEEATPLDLEKHEDKEHPSVDTLDLEEPKDRPPITVMDLEKHEAQFPASITLVDLEKHESQDPALITVVDLGNHEAQDPAPIAVVNLGKHEAQYPAPIAVVDPGKHEAQNPSPIITVADLGNYHEAQNPAPITVVDLGNHEARDPASISVVHFGNHEAPSNHDDDGIPKAGMVFESEDEIRDYFLRYATKEGFGIRKMSTKSDNVGQAKYYSLACVRGGKYVSVTKKSFSIRPSIKTDCKAKINVIVNSDGRCTISRACLEHNHALNPKETQFQRIRKKRGLELNDQVMVVRNPKVGENGVKTSTPRASQLRFGAGDAQALCDYFRLMQKRNSNFFYAIDIDDLGRLRNVVWVDARSKTAYESFGDAVVFDTSYLINKYDVPLVAFVGANHHGHPLLFGCGLVSGNDIDTYVWVFRSWLECMKERSPNAIITPQSKFVEAAAAEVFPLSHHRICIWSILKKLPENLGTLEQFKAIKKTLKSVVYESVEPEEFDESWSKMMVDYNLGANEWLTSLFTDRTRWVPVYIKTAFWAGMSVTQRGETLNPFFEDHINSKTTLKQFLDHYDDAVRSRAEKEKKADYDSMNSTYKLITGCYFEKQFQDAYTNSIFKLFQDELRGMLFCNFMEDRVDGAASTFSVTDIFKGKDGSTKKKVVYTVNYNEVACDIQCSCRLFESKGILCRHMAKILIEEDVKEIPMRYILNRWCKGVKHQYYYVASGDDRDATEKSMRFNELSGNFSEAAEIAASSPEMYEFLMVYVDEAKKKLRHDMNWYQFESGKR